MMRIFFSGLATLLVMTPLFFSPVAYSGELTVSAAASLANAFTELKTLYEQQHPGMTVHTNFAASGPLLRQIQEGAPVDVFASADQFTMNKAENADLLQPGSRADFAANGLVLIVPKKSGALLTVQDLRKDSVRRIAVGNPDSVPAGRYAKEALSKADLWNVLQEKLVLGESVRQVLDYVARGEVDAGCVYTTDAHIAAAKVDIAEVMTGHAPVLYPLAVLKNAPNPAAAKNFAELARSPEGQAILAKYGFGKP